MQRLPPQALLAQGAAVPEGTAAKPELSATMQPRECPRLENAYLPAPGLMPPTAAATAATAAAAATPGVPLVPVVAVLIVIVVALVALVIRVSLLVAIAVLATTALVLLRVVVPVAHFHPSYTWVPD